MAINFPDIDPVIFQISNFPLKITWYSLAYVVGIILGWYYIKYINKTSKLTLEISDKILDNLLTSVIIGIIVGGRLGYVIFYDLEYNIHHPLNIIKTWEGGMSFHGGLLGVIISCFIFSKINKIKFFRIMDLLACATPIGLFFGRIANFINSELYGRYTDSSLGVIFPGEKMARHASQLYEASTEGLISFIILFLVVKYTRAIEKSAMLSGLFLLLYSFFRMVIENFREPDAHIGFIFYQITMGQLLCLPMLIAGIGLILFSLKKNETFKGTNRN